MRAQLDYINLYQCDRGFATGERVFDFPYLLYVHKGLGVYKIGQTSHGGSMGDLFFCPPGVANTIIADSGDPFLLTGIDFRLIGHSGEGMPPLPQKMNILSNTFLISLINRMVAEYTDGRIHSREICGSLLEAAVYELSRFARLGLPGEESASARLLAYLKANSGRTVGLGELSQAFAYHKSSINRIITGATGMSLREYQISLRVRQAAELLAYSSRPLGEISSLCGYGSPVFFSRQFREKTGQTPGEYRRARRR